MNNNAAPSASDLDAIETEMKLLRVNYEKYFRGEERREPAQQRANLKNQIRRVMTQLGNNTARRYRAQTLQATMLAHEQYWNRICREIEEGTYHIHKLRAQRRTDAADHAGGKDGVTTATTPTAPQPEFSESMRTLHAEYHDALKLAGLAATVSMEKLATTLEQQAMLLRQRYDCRTVDFKVMLKDGKPIIKAFPK